MTKYKIVHLITSLKVGGAEAILCDLLRKSDNDLFENHVIYFYSGANLKNLQNLKIPSYYIKGFFCRYDIIFIFRLFFLIRKLKPDCIHSSLWSANVLGNIIASILKIPIVSALHLATNFESTGKNNLFRSTIDKFVLKNANKIVVVSDSMVQDIKSNKWFSINKIEVIKNSIDVNRVLQISQLNKKKRTDYNISEKSFVIGCVGRFIPRKNHHLLIQSFAILCQEYKDVDLILIGYGPLEIYLKNQIELLKIANQVHLIKSEEAYSFYPLFNCFVLPSNNESFGLVILEAMAFKLPCIVTNDSLNHEIIIDKFSGNITPTNNVNLLYKALKHLYNDKNECHRIGLNGYNSLMENFTLEKMSKQYSKLFIETINQ